MGFLRRPSRMYDPHRSALVDGAAHRPHHAAHRSSCGLENTALSANRLAILPGIVVSARHRRREMDLDHAGQDAGAVQTVRLREPPLAQFSRQTDQRAKPGLARLARRDRAFASKAAGENGVRKAATLAMTSLLRNQISAFT